MTDQDQIARQLKARMKSTAKVMQETESRFIDMSNKMLEDALVEVLKYWADKFPSRRIQHYSGMGTAGWRCESLKFDITDLTESDRKLSWAWTERGERVLKPLIAFTELFWSLDLNKYPSIEWGVYNPITRTIELGDRIINLPSIDINPR